ncbi:hypothetical protein EMGBD4_10730 [Verrucomicrobiota bacterium]|nr:hypothetical protein EMGBD4_10730 [Verrucomicrobiota bacterium]
MAGLLAVNPTRPEADALLAFARRHHDPLPAPDLAALAAQIGRMAKSPPGFPRPRPRSRAVSPRIRPSPACARRQGPTAAAYRRLLRPGAGAGALITVELRATCVGSTIVSRWPRARASACAYTLAAPFLWLAHFEK